MAGHQISMKLPNINKPVLLNVENVQNLIKGEDVVTYTGYVADDSNDFFTLSISDKAVMGKINFGKYIYIIKPLQGPANKHSIAQLEKRLMTKDLEEEVIGNGQVEKSVNYSKSSGSGRVDILFYYASDVSNPSLLVSTIVSEMNAILSRSGISSTNYIHSVGVLPANTTFSGQCRYWGIVNTLWYRQGSFATLNQEMISYNADIAFVLYSEYAASGCYPGQPGRVGGFALDYFNPAQAIATSVDSYALGDLTAIHEIGHVLGGKHTVDTITPNGTWVSSRGKTYFFFEPFDGGQEIHWQTIMGGYADVGCPFTGNGPYAFCERIPYFSNPSKYFNGVSTGEYGGNGRNMKSWLNTAMPIASQWRANTSSVPTAPNPISKQSGQCYGFNTVNWTAQSGATEYKLYRSTNSSFTNAVLQYSGTNTQTGVNVSSGTWYLRAKACNASGCSPYSNQVTASRISSCL